MASPLARALEVQADFCRTGGSPFTAAVLDAAAADLEAGGPFATVLASWRGYELGALIDAAVPLRLAGALHALALAGEHPALSAAYPPAPTPADLASRLTAAAADRADFLTGVMRSPPQTNEVRRAMGLFGGFGEVARRTRLPLATFEIGASAGLLLNWDRFAFAAADGSWRWGSDDAPVALDAEWRGGPPPLGPIPVAARRACDVAPIRVADPVQLQRLRAYVWPDQPERMARLEAAAALAVAQGVEVEAADAGAWLQAHLRPRAGVATVLYHSVMFQYLPPDSRTAVEAAIARAAAEATAQAPLAWLRFEPSLGDGARRMEVRLTLWPSGEESYLADGHAHATWIAWRGASEPGEPH